MTDIAEATKNSLVPETLAEETERARSVAAQALDRAQRLGATQAEASCAAGRALTVTVRKGEVESLEFQRDNELSLTVYIGQRSGSASTSDLSDAGIASAVEAAAAIARASGEDPCSGLADAGRMASQMHELDLLHPWKLSAEDAIEIARECEAAAMAADPRMHESEGATVDTRRGLSVYANSHGFSGSQAGTQHSLSCAVIARVGEDMERDHWYTRARCADDMDTAANVGRRAGERAAARLGAKQISTRSCPVIFPPELARGLLGSFAGAIAGSALYRRASFLLDHLGKPVFASQVHLSQQPHIPRGAASASYDQEGVATQARVLVDGGILQGWLLGSYSARKLGLETTGNAGGVFNLVAQPTAGDLKAILRDMGEGLLVTELMGQGVNRMNGDYSRGAAGYWVRNGEIAEPVDEITVAGNLLEMFLGIQAIGSDIDPHASIRCGSILIDRMTVAGS
jgi:PmbA protein